MRAVRPFILALSLALVLIAGGHIARAQDLAGSMQALGSASSYPDIEKAIIALAATGDSHVTPILDALERGALYSRKSDHRLVIAKDADAGYALLDPLTGASLGTASDGELDKIRVNNAVRRAIDSARGVLTLMNPDPAVRRAAAEAVFKSRNVEALDALSAAIAAERDNGVRTVMLQAQAAATLASSEASEADKRAAVPLLRQRGDQDAIGLLAESRNDASPALKADIDAAIAGVQSGLALWDIAQNIWYGLSLGSVLLLAAIGLAVTFGVMGVINMAHGEMVMIGAYTTFVVQELIRTRAPGLFDFSLFIALPLAFLIAGGIGIAIERTIIQWLYGRPLETLLATWGLSLMLQQAVRSIFGPTNREVGSPSFMSGTFQLGHLAITYNRLCIMIFALAVFLALVGVLRYTAAGLRMRAVTQNRAMAAAMGIRTKRVDALTFGLGSGIAGLAGVALSQIDNVSPNLGQGYIIDSFMVVVFGGVGNLWGTLIGAASLGIANKLLEPVAGAVLGKIFVLVLIILFIQKRPRGLFALRGRAVEG